MPYPVNNGHSHGGLFFSRPPVRVFLALLVGVAGALLAKPAGIPVPYLIGPLVACAAASVAGAPVTAIPFGRELGQTVIGLAIGLRFVPAVLLAMLKLMPAMVLATVATVIGTMMAAFMLRKVGGVDRKTAFFATAAAGLAEMAVVAQQKGANADTVAVVHLVRVTAIVTTVPFLVTFFGTQGAIDPPPVPLAGLALPLVFLLALSAAASLVVRPLGFPNTWLLVPAAIGVLVAGLGLGPFVMPPIVLTLAQISIGIWLGCRFRRELLGRLPRVTASALATTAFLIFVACVVAGLLSTMTGLPFVTSLLAVAPAGVTEMVVTATAMHLDAATVTAFQITRIAVVMTTILIAFKAFENVSRWIEKTTA